MSFTLNELRKEYTREKLDEHSVPDDPFTLFDLWFEEATMSKSPEPNALALSTVDSEGRPTSRIVLLKEVRDGGFYFFTNYLSKKGRDMEANPNVALLFFWHELERQIRVNGTVQKISREETLAYYKTRPRQSRLGALSSRQSEVLEKREILEKVFEENDKAYSGDEIPCPEYWGGYKVTPVCFEFWQGRENRLHDRVEYIVDGENWVKRRLYP